MTISLLLLLAFAADAPAAERVRAQAETFKGGRVVDRAVLVTRAATLRRSMRTPAGATVRVRVRGRACGGRLTMRAGGSPATVRLRDGGWRWLALAPGMPGGRQRVELRVRGLRRGCRAALRIDAIDFVPPAPQAPPPAPPPQPAPQPQPQPTPPPADPPNEPPLLPPSPLSPLLPDVERPGPVKLGAALFWSHANTDLAYRGAFLEHFDALTPENEMKWERLQPRPGVFAFAEADALVAFAQENEKPIHGHTLVWHGQTPAWVETLGTTRATLLQIMRDHIHAVLGHFKGRVTEWDVVNEPFNDDGSYRDSFWHRVIGPDYVEQALRFAREADPDAKLFINEIGADVPNAKSDALFHLAETYELLGVPLDGVGFQNHTNHNGYPRRPALQQNLERFASLGLDVQITEMDVAAKGDAASLEQRLTAHAAAFRDAALACQSVPACTRLTAWGVTDRYSWIGADEIPLLLDADLQPKPALKAVREVIGG